jgi:DNA-binding response OmpR family regulator
MKRVLIIDDHEPSRKTLVKTLTQNGYEIAGEGASGETAVALTATTSPDIVLMAVGLSDIDGIKAAGNIMQAKPLPIILITSHHDSTTVQRATKSGAMGYLIKPLRNGELTPAIELALSRCRDFVSLREEGGCDRHKPVALIQSGTNISQEKLDGTVSTIASFAQRWQFHGATVIVVGEVVRLGKDLEWFQQANRSQPLPVWTRRNRIAASNCGN